MDNRFDVSIILVNYNTRDITIECISSVIEHTSGISYEIIVVDNNSIDGSADEIEKRFDNVKVVKSQKNLGFAGGCNLGVKYAKGKYLLFLNTDTILLENSIKVMFDFMESNDDYGVIGVLLIDKENHVVQSWGDFLPFKLGIKDYILKPFLPKSLKNNFSSNKKYDDFVSSFFGSEDVKEVDYVIGADLFIGRSLFENIGGFDEQFFMYFEEADLQIRVKRLGLKIGIIKFTKIIHLESKSFKVSNLKRSMKVVSFLRYLRKNFLFYYLLFKPFYLVYALIKTFVDLVIKEYTFKENLFFMKSLVLEKYYI
ncbi:MAG: glycosyltransferase family 2 protein [Brevinematales bacterium]|nr:glycosyltransferase family 2 protein [Brevinematales bacterium]